MRRRVVTLSPNRSDFPAIHSIFPEGVSTYTTSQHAAPRKASCKKLTKHTTCTSSPFWESSANIPADSPSVTLPYRKLKTDDRKNLFI